MRSSGASPLCRRTLAVPGVADRGRPTIASQPCASLSTRVLLPSKVTTGTGVSGASRRTLSTPPGTMLICGSSGAALAHRQAQTRTTAAITRADECCRLMGSTFPEHARAQTSAVESRFDLIADIDARGVRDERAVRGPRDDRKAAGERRERPHVM